MSYGREWIEDMAIDAEIWYEEENRRIGDGIWQQKDGKQIQVMDMETSHIRNCIRMLERQVQKYGIDDIKEGWLFRFRSELQKRGV